MTKHLDPNPAIETPEALMQKVECLERRMSTLEILLNDVMMQIDKPFKHENQFASKQKPNRKQSSNGKAPKAKEKLKPKQKKDTSKVKERILAYLSTESTPKGTRVISQAVRTKFQETKTALHQLLNAQEITYVENKGYQRKD